MKFVSNEVSFSSVSDDGATHTVTLPIYHRSAVGVFPGTRVFAVPLTGTNELVLTPIHPRTWGDLWRLEATVVDRPGAAKRLVETLVRENVNVLVHEGVSESTERGPSVHQIFEILDLSAYSHPIDGTTETRNSVEKPLLKPNRLISQLISNAEDYIPVDRNSAGWELSFERMEFFFRNKEARRSNVELSLNVEHEVHVPARLLRDMPFVDDPSAKLALHIISDTEQKYVKLRVLSPERYYLLLEVEHEERVGAIDDFMRVLRAHDANMIDSYSRLKRVDETALFYALAEFSNEVSPDHLREITTDLANGELTEGVVLKGSFGAGPPLTATVGEDLKLPQGVTVRQPEGPTDVTGARKRRARQAEPDRRSDLGAPYYQRRRGGSAWTLKPAEVFMAVPFSEIYAPFYRDYIAAAVRDAGLEPIRVDELPVDAEWRQTIDRIEEGIARARFVLADVSGWNLNVIYEVGLAVGISKPLLVLCDAEHLEKREIPFDIAPYPLVKYSLWESGNFRADLSAKIRQMSKATEPPGTAA